MKKLKSSAAVKVIAVLLIVLMVGAVIASGVGVAALAVFDAYTDSLENTQENMLQNICDERSYSAIWQICYYEAAPEGIFADSAFCFKLEDESGNILYDNLNGRKTQAKTETVEYTAPGSSRVIYDESQHGYDTQVSLSEGTLEDVEADITTPTPGVYETPVPTTSTETAEIQPDKPEVTAIPRPDGNGKYTLTGYILADIPEGDEINLALSAISFGYNMRYSIIIIAAAAFILGILLFVFLMSAAGHKPDTDEIRGSFLEKLPFDVFTALVIAVEAVICAMLAEIGYHNDFLVLMLIAFAVGGALFILVGLIWCMSWAVRIKQGTALKGCLCYKILSWIWRMIKSFFSLLKELVQGLPLMPKAAVIVFAVLLAEFIFICAAGDNMGAQLFGWFIERAALVLLVLYTLLCMKKLLKAGKEIASGNMSYTVDTDRMYGPLKEHGEDLNSISSGLNKAVSERMKSEHFKTELITNVSHDIKTPLTSIINYVDLMEKEQPENERMKDYLEVLSRQSSRLKKLIDDLLEASKASTGNLPVNLAPCELGVLIDQCAGEYGEKLQAAELELVVNKPENSLTIMADGRHMWRILDNLLNNACKYAQRGTRVYLTLERQGDRAVVILRNISESMLNVSGDELMERFVRGDSSRSTEGSGLGLSIARSLTELQKGEMKLTVDGDLFKVTLSFNIA